MPEKHLTFATFNLFNLQLPGKPMYHGRTYDKKEYEKKIKWTASMLLESNADIIGFQELWSPRALKQAFSEAGLDEKYQIITYGNNTSQVSVALAVQADFSIASHNWYKNFPEETVLIKRQSRKRRTSEPDYQVSVSINKFSRAVLRTKVRPKFPTGTLLPDIVVFLAHLKSKLPMDLDTKESQDERIRPHNKALGSALSTIRRTAEAAALRVLLNKTMRKSNTPVVVMGDLNDAQLSVTTSIITEQPKYRLFASSRVGRKSDKGLYSTATLQEYRSLRDVYYTHVHEGHRESLDHILVSEQFYDHSNQRIWTFREMRVINDHLDDDTPATSDHAVITATFDYNPA